MDMAAWLWDRVERRDAPAVLAHALSLAPTRDALLRQASITGQWDRLAAASAEAADVARHVGWSRSGPDAVTAICHWISADRTLRAIPAADRAFPLAQASLAAWAAPGELAERLAASAPLSPADSSDFEDALTDEATWLHAVDEVEQRLGDGLEAIRGVGEDDQARAVVLRSAARTGEWEDLAGHFKEAADDATANGTPNPWAEQIAQLSAWMSGAGRTLDPQPPPAEIAETLAQGKRSGPTHSVAGVLRGRRDFGASHESLLVPAPDEAQGPTRNRSAEPR